MTIFDLLFILLFLASIVTFLTSAAVWMRGNRPAALRIQKRYWICFAIYMTIVAAVALTAPQRIIHLGEDRCFDDWCIAVQRADHEGATYIVTFKISSRAKRVTQREKGMDPYLIDAQGRRFDSAPAPQAIPMDVLLAPGEAVETTRSFTLPNDARDLGVVFAHEGSHCFPGCFIIGDDGNPLHKRTVVPLP
jgi:hypothetical protein